MKLEFSATVLFVKDISKSKQFYTDVLSQKIKHDFGNNITFESDIALWQIPEKHELNNSYYTKNNQNKALELYFETTNIESIHDEISNHNLSICNDLKEEFWGQKTFRFFDLDNNLIEIGESLDTFITRMYNDGLTREQVSEKTGVPIETINNILK